MSFTVSRSRLLAVGVGISTRRWKGDAYGTLTVSLRQEKGFNAEIGARVNAQEARQLANDLNDLADHLEGQVEG